MNRRGFTLLEMLVASALMAIAVVGLLSNLSTSMRNAANLAGYDRAAALAQERMDELLLDTRLPQGAVLDGTFDRAVTGEDVVQWHAQLSTFETPPQLTPGVSVLERISLDVTWGQGRSRRTLSVEGFRPHVLTPAEAPPPQP